MPAGQQRDDGQADGLVLALDHRGDGLSQLRDLAGDGDRHWLKNSGPSVTKLDCGRLAFQFYVEIASLTSDFAFPNSPLVVSVWIQCLKKYSWVFESPYRTFSFPY